MPEQDDSCKGPSLVHVLLQPEEKELQIPRRQAKTVAQLLRLLGLRPSSALVVRDEQLLTPDLPLYPGQKVMVRSVMSRG